MPGQVVGTLQHDATSRERVSINNHCYRSNLKDRRKSIVLFSISESSMTHSEGRQLKEAVPQLLETLGMIFAEQEHCPTTAAKIDMKQHGSNCLVDKCESDSQMIRVSSTKSLRFICASSW